jgi:hypothetical protein
MFISVLLQQQTARELQSSQLSQAARCELPLCRTYSTNSHTTKCVLVISTQ